MKRIKNILNKFSTALNCAGSDNDECHKKLLLAEIMMRLRKSRKKKFGLFVIFGWQNKWNKRYVDVADASQDVFARHEMNILRRQSFQRIASTVNFDGAILIDHDGRIIHSGIILEGLRPRQLANHLSPHDQHSDLSTRLGFKTKVHSRHLSAITASWELKGTTVFTVSEETGDVHVFENGRIIFSTVRDEIS